ncbi:universal stress protein [Azohydromonas australica]|uniref:universal stress protein n=1 Tax=Azohydromonas australica TaxID=364039 RepID=UPI0004235B53|nr:universal stress protein [Azohydromonas australica]
MYTRILFPTDGSEVCSKALRHALDLAKLCGAELHALSAKEMFPYGAVSDLQPTPPQEFMEDQERTASERVKAVMEAARQAGVSCRGSTVEAVQPWEAICGYAAEHGCDLIVMGSHGRHGLTALLRGSETPRVLGHCSVPVLVVR